MSYRPHYLANKRLPSYAGFLVMLIAIGITVVLSKNSFSTVSKATVGAQPKNMQISNVTPTSFTVSYTTDAPALGSLGYGSDPTSATVALDDRDTQSGKAVEHQVHYFTIKNLNPSTTYYYLIQSGDQHADDNGKPFQMSTPASMSAEPNKLPTMSGSVAAGDGSTPTEAVVTVSADGTQLLSALVGSNGIYQIPLSNLLNNTFTASATISADAILNVEARTGTQQSTVKVIANQASQVPQIVLSQNYNFTLSPDSGSSDSAIASGSSLPLLSTPAPVNGPEITSPKDSQSYKNQQPVFSGRALPNQSVTITIHSQEEINTTVQSDDTGSWQFKPPVQLAPGKHTITITSNDTSGILQTISRSFTVYAAGSQFVEPSVSPIETSPSPVASISPTLVPTSIPTPTATPSPTLAPTPAATVPPARGPMAPTGSSALLSGIIGGAIAVGIGALLFFFAAI